MTEKSEGAARTGGLSRRRLVAGAATAAGTAALAPVLGAPSAQARTTASYDATVAPTPLERHYLCRLGFGHSATDLARIKAAGSPAAWFADQLDATIEQNPTAVAVDSWFPDLKKAPDAMWRDFQAGKKGGWDYANDISNYSAMKQTYSSRQLFERMVRFWSSHLHVHAKGDIAWVHRASYDRTIRQNAMGRFEDLLVAASLHPAMLLYLSNWRSGKNMVNENQGRELLELHTVGLASGYTEAMVRDSANILSGYTVNAYGNWAGVYDPTKHTTGPVTVLGFSSANASTDGRQLTVDYLKYLANHSATAMNIARKLCLAFISDSPSTGVVSAVAAAYRQSGTDIKETLKALVAHPEFAQSQGELFRDPTEDAVATTRALGMIATPPTGPRALARQIALLPRSIPIYQWPRPDGGPATSGEWATPAQLLNSFSMHWILSTGSPKVSDKRFTPGPAWLPTPSIRFDLFVDHLCRKVLGKPSEDRILQAAVTATGYDASTIVTKGHNAVNQYWNRLIGTLLDSPDHLCR